MARKYYRAVTKSNRSLQSLKMSSMRLTRRIIRFKSILTAQVWEKIKAPSSLKCWTLKRLSNSSSYQIQKFAPLSIGRNQTISKTRLTRQCWSPESILNTKSQTTCFPIKNPTQSNNSFKGEQSSQRKDAFPLSLLKIKMSRCMTATQAHLYLLKRPWWIIRWL